MALGFGDRSTVELLLEIKGRADTGAMVSKAARDMRALADAQRETNAMSDAENNLLKTKNDLRKAALDLGRLEQAQESYSRTTTPFDNVDANTRRYMNDAQKAEQELQKYGMTRRMLERRLEQTGLTPSEYAQKVREGQYLSGRSELYRQGLADRIMNVQRASEDLGMRHEEAIQKVANTEDAARAAAEGLAKFNDEQATSKTDGMDLARTLDDVGSKMDRLGNRTHIATDLMHGMEKPVDDAGKIIQKTGLEVDKTSSALKRAGSEIDKFGDKANRWGVGILRAGMLIGMPAVALGQFFRVAGLADSAFSKFIGVLGPAAGPLSAVLGLLTAIAGVFLILPAAILAVVTVWQALTTVVGIGAAAFVAFIPPITLLAGLLGPLAAGFAFVTEQVFAQSANLGNARRAYQADVQAYHAAVTAHGATSRQALTALNTLKTAQTTLSDAERSQGFSHQVTGMTHQLDNIIKGFGRQAAPEIQLVLTQAKGLLDFAQKLVGMPVTEMFRQIAGKGVNLLYKDAEQWGHIIGPIIRSAIDVAFGDDSNIRNKMLAVWTQLHHFFLGPQGALNPIEQWFDKQHIEKVGIRFSDEFNHWLSQSGIFNNIADLLGVAIENGFKNGLSAGLGFLKTELTTVGGWGNIGKGLIGQGGFSGTLMAGLLLGGGLRVGAASLGSLFPTGAVAGAGAGSIAAGAAGAGGIGLLGSLGLAALVAAPLLGPGLLLGHDKVTLASMSPGIRTVMSRISGFGRIPGSAMEAQLQSVLPQFISILSAHGGINRFNRADTLGGAAAISSILGLDPRAAELNRSFSLAAHRPLAPNELALLALNMRSRAGIAQFARISGGRLPSQEAINIIGTGHAQAAIATLIAETHKLATPHQVRVLTDIPRIALPAIERLIERIHHMPTKKQIEVTVDKVEKTQKDISDTQRQVQNLAHEKYQIGIHGNTSQVDHSLTQLHQKLAQLEHNRINSGKSVYFHPNYSLIHQNTHALGQAIDEGVAQGITVNETVMNLAGTAAINQLFAQMRAQIKSGSPSKRAAEEIGLPIIQGISEGMLKGVLQAQNTNKVRSVMDTILQTMMSTFDNFKSEFQTAMGNLFSGPGGTGTFLRTGMPTPLSILSGIPGAKIPFSMVRADLAEQIATMKKFTHSIRELRRRYPDLMVQQIIALGPSAQPEIDALLSASSGEAKQYSKMFEEANRLINTGSEAATLSQLDVWRRAGKGVAVGILAGLRSAEPGIEDYLARIATKMFSHAANTGSGHHGSHHGMTVHQHIQVNNASTDTILRRSAWHLRNITT